MSKADTKLLNELRQIKGFSEDFVESLQDGLLIINLKGKIILCNNALTQITGFAKEELVDINLPFPYWPTELHEKYSRLFKNMPKDKLKRELEVTYQHKNGDRFPVVVLIAKIKNNKAKTIAYLALIQDIVKGNKRDIDDGFQNSEIFSILNYRKNYLDIIIDKKIASQLDYTINNISDGFLSLDKDFYYTYLNEKAGEILGKNQAI